LYKLRLSKFFQFTAQMNYLYREMDLQKLVSFESSLLKGKALRFSYNYARPPSCESPVKDSAPPRTIVGYWILIPNAAMKIHCAVGMGKRGEFVLVSTALQASSRNSQYRGAFIAPLPTEKKTTFWVLKVHCTIGYSFQICSWHYCQQL
jgi:hypothetical protein